MKKVGYSIILLLLFNVSHIYSQCTTDVPASEKQALIDFYTATSGANWTDNTNWNTSACVSDWYGVTVTNGNVTNLDLNSNNLQGNIPTELGNLPFLETCILYTNLLTGDIPSSIGNLTNLETLSLSENQLTSIPSSIANLINLEVFYISDNLLSGNIPSEIGSLTSLVELSLHANQFTGTIPSSFSGLTGLYFMHLNDNQLSGVFPSGLASISNFRGFRFHNNNFVFKDFETEHVALTSALISFYTYSPQNKVDQEETSTVTEGASYTFTTSLSSTNNSYQWYKDDVAIPGATSKDYTINSVASTDAGVYHITATNSIVTGLTIQRNDITLATTTDTCGVSTSERDALMALYNATDGANWTNNTNWNTTTPVCDWYGVTVTNGTITELNLNNNNLQGNIPQEIGNLTNIQSLRLYSNQLSGSIPTQMGNLTNLTWLDLYSNQLSGNIPATLGNLVALTNLNLYINQFSGNIPSQLGDLINLNTLDLRSNGLSGDIPTELSLLASLNNFIFHTNAFIFSDFENEHTTYASSLNLYTYSPQAKVDQEETPTVTEGASYTFTTSLSSTNNSYQWYKDDVAIPGATSKDYTINSVASTDAGVYHVLATNSIITGLTLQRNDITLATTTDTCGVSTSERDALMALYNATGGANWTNNTNWDTTTPVCDWYGVTVTNGNVTNLDLNSNNLQGNIPTEFGSLPLLETCILYTNQLTGDIPSSIGDLTNLKTLSLSENQLTSIPSSIANLINLEVFYISDNQLSGSIPSEIGSLTNLVELSLHANQFTGTIPSSFSGLTGLYFMHLNDNQLSGVFPSGLTSINNFRGFRFHNNNFVFKDFETEHVALTNALISFYTYSPQAKVDQEETPTVTEGASYTFTTSLSSTNNSYQWYKDDVAIPGATSKDYTINSVASTDAGVYHVLATNSIITGLTLERNTITVTTNGGETGAPIANAGTDVSLILPTNSVILNGSQSSDSDGTLVSYLWTKLSGVAGTLDDATLISPALSGLTTGTYVFELTVTDNDGLTDTDTVTITVTTDGGETGAPIANAGTDVSLILPTSSVTLNGSQSSDSDGTLVSYLWTKLSGVAGTLDDATLISPALSGLTAGTYVFELTVTDNDGLTDTDTVTITVTTDGGQTGAPIANAGTDVSLILPTSSVTLNGSQSSDSDGTLVSYLWTKLSGAALTIDDATLISPALSGLTTGTYVFELTVTDNDGLTDTDTVTITVTTDGGQTGAPIANAGTDVSLILPTNSVTLDGSQSSDNDGTLVSYLWTKLSGVAGTLDDATLISPALSGLTTGTYVFELTVTDNDGLTDTDTVTITVTTDGGQTGAPIANAGTDVSLILPTNSVTLNGSQSSDSDGTLVSYLWTKLSGVAGTLDDATLIGPVLSGLTTGTYVFELTVTDNDGLTDTDTVTITVTTDGGQTGAPIANAGTDVSLILPTNSVTLDGSQSSDSDGTLVSYLWTKLSGAALTIDDATLIGPVLSGLTTGTYVFELTVTDNDGLTDTDTVTITVEEEQLDACGVSHSIRDILLEFYQATNGANWTNTLANNQPWDINIPVCDWYGITTGLNSTTAKFGVLDIYLSNNNLEGYIPESLGDLPEYKNIDLSNNKLSGGSVPVLKAFLSTIIKNNEFVFGDLEENILENINYPRANSLIFDYYPQAKVDEEETLIAIEGQSITLTSTRLYSTSNTYQWYKNGVAITGATSKNYVISSPTVADEGFYHFLADNPNMSNLTLERRPITLIVNSSTPPITTYCPEAASAEAALTNLLNHLIDEVRLGTEIPSVYNPSEMQALAPYINCSNPAVYNLDFSYPDEAMIAINFSYGIDCCQQSFTLYWDHVTLQGQGLSTKESLVDFKSISISETLDSYTVVYDYIDKDNNLDIANSLINFLGYTAYPDTNDFGITLSMDCLNISCNSNNANIFCSNGLEEDLTVADLSPSGTNIEWYTTETGGVAIDSTEELVEETVDLGGITYWWDDPTDAISTRTGTLVQVLVAIEGENQQLFSKYGPVPTIADIEVYNSDEPVFWYSSDSSVIVLSTNTPLEHGKTYYASPCDAGNTNCVCRFPVTIILGVIPPEGDRVQYLCEQSTLDDIVLEFEDEYGLSVQWYDSEEGGNLLAGNTPVVSDTTYYASQIDSTNNEESEIREAVLVSVQSPPDAPVVKDSTQKFYASNLPTVAHLRATGANIKWYSQLEDGNVYDESHLLVDGTIYYAEQVFGLGSCSSIIRVPVTVEISNEPADPLYGCELFRPELLGHYVVDGWVNEREVSSEETASLPFNDSDKSKLFVALLNHLKNRLMSTNEKLRDIPAEYDPVFTAEEEQLDLAPLMGYIEGLSNNEEKLIVYDFKAENDSYGRAIGFSFYLNAAKSPDKQFVYKTPVFTYSVPNVTSTGVTEITKTEHYPLSDNEESTNDDYLNFTDVRVTDSGAFEIDADFNQVSEPIHQESQVSTESNSNVIKSEITLFKYTEVAYQAAQTYTNTEIEISFLDPEGDAIGSTMLFSPHGDIIDKWQKITGDFTVPNGAGKMIISLKNNDPNKIAYFDDLRILPYNGNIKTFVYHPENQRLMSELDENNYATFYEYDAEGGLIRVKKETVKGTYTIQETRSGNIKATN